MLKRQFDAEKAAAALAYLVQETGAEMYAALKMLYLADKGHLEKYGRTITGDSYVAMKQGPVPDRAYNMCKFVRGDRSYFDELPEARERLRLRSNSFELLTPPDLDALSASEKDALDEWIAEFRRGGWRVLWRRSHDAAWSAAWAEARARDRGAIEMDLRAIAATLPNGPALIEYLTDPHPGEAPARSCAQG